MKVKKYWDSLTLSWASSIKMYIDKQVIDHKEELRKIGLKVTGNKSAQVWMPSIGYQDE